MRGLLLSTVKGHLERTTIFCWFHIVYNDPSVLHHCFPYLRVLQKKSNKMNPNTTSIIKHSPYFKPDYLLTDTRGTNTGPGGHWWTETSDPRGELEEEEWGSGGRRGGRLELKTGGVQRRVEERLSVSAGGHVHLLMGVGRLLQHVTTDWSDKHRGQERRAAWWERRERLMCSHVTPVFTRALMLTVTAADAHQRRQHPKALQCFRERLCWGGTHV